MRRPLFRLFDVDFSGRPTDAEIADVPASQRAGYRHATKYGPIVITVHLTIVASVIMLALWHRYRFAPHHRRPQCSE
jgi:hypothetical protein